MEVAISPMDFDFHSARSTPFTSPPSTPKPFNGDYYYVSAPPSPSHISEFYREIDSLFITDKSEIGGSYGDIDEFAFDVSQELVKDSVSADDLFDGGMIKPLIPKTEHENRGKQRKTEHESRGKQSKTGGFSSRIAVEKSTKTERESRGKQRISNGLSNSSSRRSARSLSPRRVTKYPWEEEQQQQQEHEETSKTSSIMCSSSNKGSKKWRFKDLFLFRSASEGRASDKDPLKKYTAAIAASSSKSIVPAKKGKKGQVSAHELHYTVNRAVSIDLKRKTFLPYKQGILGQLAFNPAVHALANGFGLYRK